MAVIQFPAWLAGFGVRLGELDVSARKCGGSAGKLLEPPVKFAMSAMLFDARAIEFAMPTVEFTGSIAEFAVPLHLFGVPAKK